MPHDQTGVGMSAYENISERPTPWWTDNGIYMGFEIAPPDDPAHLLRGDWKCTGTLQGYRGDRHILTVGPNGSGKSRRLLMPNLYYLKNWSICCIDPKGELFAQTAVYRSKLPGHKVMLFDPFSVVKTTYPKLAAAHPKLCESVGCNPVAALRPTLPDGTDNPRFVDDVKALAVSLIKTETTKEAYWSLAAQALLKGLIMAQRIEMEKEVEASKRKFAKGEITAVYHAKEIKGLTASLPLLRQVLGDTAEGLAREIARLVATYGKDYPAVMAALGEFIKDNPQDRELGAIRRQAKTQTDWLDSGEMIADLEKDNGSLPLLKEQPATIYLVLPPEFLASHGTWLRLMITTILRPMLRSVAPPSGDKTQVPVLFMLDEFAQLGHMEIIKDNYALMRGYGIKLWTIWQDLNQAKMLYGEWWESLMSNAGIKQAFAPQDYTSQKYLSDLGGERMTWHMVESYSASGGMEVKSMSASQSVSKTSVKEPLMYPHELGEMAQGQSVVFVAAGRGGKMQRRYFPDATHPAFAGVKDMMTEAAKIQNQ